MTTEIKKLWNKRRHHPTEFKKLKDDTTKEFNDLKSQIQKTQEELTFERSMLTALLRKVPSDLATDIKESFKKVENLYKNINLMKSKMISLEKLIKQYEYIDQYIKAEPEIKAKKQEQRNKLKKDLYEKLLDNGSSSFAVPLLDSEIDEE